jgi:hypothetical protein
MFTRILTGFLVCIFITAYGENVSEKADAEKKIENNNVDKLKPALIIKTELTRGKDLISSPRIVVCDGKKAKIRLVKEIYFPESWKPADISKSKGVKFAPFIPVFGNSTDVGITVSLTGNIVEYPEKGEIIVLSGKFTLTQAQKTKKMDVPGFEYKNFQYSIKSFTEGFLLYFVDTDEQEIKFQDGDVPCKIKFIVKKISDLKSKSKKTGKGKI